MCTIKCVITLVAPPTVTSDASKAKMGMRVAVGDDDELLSEVVNEEGEGERGPDLRFRINVLPDAPHKLVLHDLEPPEEVSVEGGAGGGAGEAASRSGNSGNSGTKRAQVYCGEVMALSLHVEDKYGNPWRR